MIIEDKVIEVGGEEFRIQPFPAFKGLVYLKKLVKIVGPSLASALGEDGEVKEGSLNLDKAIELLVQNFDGDGVETLIKDLIKSVTKNGQPLNFDIEFMADYGKLFKLLTEVIKVNYGSVFQYGDLLKELN